MKNSQRAVFVAAQVDGPAFAFEAENAAAAEKLARMPWFAQSLFRAYAKPRNGWSDDRGWHVRAATSGEADAYRGWLTEFAEEANDLLVTPLK